MDWNWALGVVFAVAAVVAILDWLGIKPSWGPMNWPLSKSWKLALALFLTCLNLAALLIRRSEKVVFDPKRELAEVKDRKFVNEEVGLDGTSYFNCTFENVTFVYHGTARMGDFAHNVLTPNRGFKTDSDVVSNTIAAMGALGFMKDDIPMFTGPNRAPLQNFESPKLVPRTP